jgi:hypothetical protein
MGFTVTAKCDACTKEMRADATTEAEAVARTGGVFVVMGGVVSHLVCSTCAVALRRPNGLRSGIVGMQALDRMEEAVRMLQSRESDEHKVVQALRLLKS